MRGWEFYLKNINNEEIMKIYKTQLSAGFEITGVGG